MNARSLLSLLFHGKKALDLVDAARRMGIVARLDRGPVTLAELARETGAIEKRLYKLMDGLESLGLVVRTQPDDAIGSAVYSTKEPLGPAVDAVLGEGSIERDRDTYPWRETFEKIPEIVRGERTPAGFSWPPATDEELRAFEKSMTQGAPPIALALRDAGDCLFPKRDARWLDVGGGDGFVAEELLAVHPELRADVYNLAAAEPLVRARSEKLGHARLGFYPGNFLEEPLPSGYDTISFVRVLHDWPADVARTLVTKAFDALPSGGTIFVCEEFRNAERLAVQFFWTYFLVGFDTCVSRLREREWYEEAFTRAGFTDVAFRPGGFEVVFARKP